MKVATVFGSSKCKVGSADYELALQVGRVLGERGFAVCNGGYTGTMEASSKGAREFAVHTIGVTLEQFKFPPNEFTVEEIRAASYWERLRTLIAKGDFYVVLKGGTGTLIELGMVAEMMIKDMAAQKPIFVFDPYWKPVIDTLRGEIDTPDPRFAMKHESKVDAVIRGFDDLAGLNRLLDF